MNSTLPFGPVLFWEYRLPDLGCGNSWPFNNIGQARVLQNTGSSVSHIQEHLVQCAVVSIPCDQSSQLIRVSEWRERPVDQANDLTEPNLGRGTARLIATLCATYALDNASVLQFKQDYYSSRNFFGRPPSEAMSRILMAPCWYLRANVIIACNAYSPF